MDAEIYQFLKLLCNICLLKGRHMTKEKIDSLIRYIREETEKNTKTPEDARKFLMRTGIYNKQGELKEQFGGKVGVR